MTLNEVYDGSWRYLDRQWGKVSRGGCKFVHREEKRGTDTPTEYANRQIYRNKKLISGCLRLGSGVGEQRGMTANR